MIQHQGSGSVHSESQSFMFILAIGIFENGYQVSVVTIIIMIAYAHLPIENGWKYRETNLFN